MKPIMQSQNKIHQFAASELKRLLNGRGHDLIRLSSGDDAEDGFRIFRKRDGIEIHGNNSRSLLFGIYAFLKRHAGCRWFHPGEEIAPKQVQLRIDLRKPWSEKPTIARRYIFPEDKVFTLSLMQKFIEWAPRNMIGDITISFNAWEEWRTKLVPEIEKRGLSVALSGHCLRMFIPKNRFKTRPEWFAEIKGARTEKGQYCFCNPSFRRALSSKIIAFLKDERIVQRLSIWAEDTALVCECTACGRKGFLKSFVDCIDEVARIIRKRLPGVAIDFLAYNAALAWDMIEPPRGLKFSNCSTEIAYWGRDYRFGLKNSRQAADRRAERCLRNWRRASKRSVSLLEYYTDIWMLTHLIPPLPRRIAQDCKDYAAIGLDAVGPLICLSPPARNFRTPIRDHFAPLIYPNLYFFATFAWNARQRVQTVLDDYARHRFGADARRCLSYLQTMEKTLAIIPSFNQTLFRLRFVDIWTRDVTPKEGGIQFVPQDWTPEKRWNREERRRFRVCAQMIERMERHEKQCGWSLVEKNSGCKARTQALRSLWSSTLHRLRGIYFQLRAQETIRSFHHPALRIPQPTPPLRVPIAEMSF